MRILYTCLFVSMCLSPSQFIFSNEKYIKILSTVLLWFTITYSLSRSKSWKWCSSLLQLTTATGTKFTYTTHFLSKEWTNKIETHNIKNQREGEKRVFKRIRLKLFVSFGYFLPSYFLFSEMWGRHFWVDSCRYNQMPRRTQITNFPPYICNMFLATIWFF